MGRVASGMSEVASEHAWHLYFRGERQECVALQLVSSAMRKIVTKNQAIGKAQITASIVRQDDPT